MTEASSQDSPALKGVSMEDALRHTGGFGRFQYKAGLLFQGMSTFSFALYPMTFFELQPQYLCR